MKDNNSLGNYSVRRPKGSRIVQKIENKKAAPERGAQEWRKCRNRPRFSTDLRPSLNRLKGTPIDRL